MAVSINGTPVYIPVAFFLIDAIPSPVGMLHMYLLVTALMRGVGRRFVNGYNKQFS